MAEQFTISATSIPAGHSVSVDCGAAYPYAVAPGATGSALATRCLSWDFGDGCSVPNPIYAAASNISNLVTRAAVQAVLTALKILVTVDVGHAYPGRFAAHRYLNAGTYTITLTSYQRNADGTAGKLEGTYKQTVTVTPAGRTVYYVNGKTGIDTNPGTAAQPIKTADRANAMIGNNTEFRFATNQTYTLTSPLNLDGKTNVVFGVPWGTGTATLYRTTVPNNTDILTIGPGTSNVCIQGLILDSPSTASTDIAGNPFNPGTATVGILRGKGITIADCQFSHLQHGPQGDPSLNGALLLRCNQIGANINSNVTWWEGTHFCLAGCSYNGSGWEPTIRADGNGAAGCYGIRNSSIVCCKTAQNLVNGVGNGKEDLTIRFGSGVDLYNNLSVDGMFRLNVPGTTEAGAAADTVQNPDVRNNLILGLDVPANGGSFEILPGIINAIVQDNLSLQPSQCYKITSAAAGAISTSGVTWHNNKGYTVQPNGVLLTVPAIPTGFISDYALPAAQVVGATPSLTVAAPLLGAAVMPATQPSN